MFIDFFQKNLFPVRFCLKQPRSQQIQIFCFPDLHLFHILCPTVIPRRPRRIFLIQKSLQNSKSVLYCLIQKNCSRFFRNLKIKKQQCSQSDRHAVIFYHQLTGTRTGFPVDPLHPVTFPVLPDLENLRGIISWPFLIVFFTFNQLFPNLRCDFYQGLIILRKY